ncbi:hypothetical protein RB614_32410 [Phytohabitans sp. ZYX-F-186]|uniref:Peptidase n=1 Tax=Phytohabitans maris TaxID=3071409 RepID=A0ABU0ZQF3_9ACTN|nr:hypothetical protein [Phytohabitans sp. ZYX-F-186]MDQ7909235.1 hypothetical protein [Phytohabitans sp. ZYX-F-186]
MLGLGAAGYPAAGAQAAPEGDGSFGIQLLDAPTDRRDDPRAHRYIVDHLAPGSVIHRRVRVVNNARDTLHIELYPAAATVNKSGFHFLPDRATNELTSWMSVKPASLTVDAGQAVTPTVTITVPPRASAGERYAVVWAAVSSAPGGAVRQVSRAGVRVYLNVGPGGDPPSGFDMGELTPGRGKDGTPWADVTVQNTGQRALDITGEMLLSDGPAGARAGPFKVAGGTTVGVGQSGKVTVPLPRNLPNGPWTARVDLRSGPVSRSASARVAFPDPGETGLIALFTGANTTRTVVAVSVLVPLVLLTGLAAVARRSRRRAASQAA